MSPLQMAAEIDYVLKFLTVSFDSFGFKTDRVRQWTFLTIALAIERDWKINEQDLRKNVGFESLINHSSAKYHHAPKFIKSFANDYGSFLSRRKDDEGGEKGKTKKASKAKRIPRV